MAPRAWGCESAQAGAKLCARGVMRAYLAIHSHARFGFLWGLPVLKRRSVENEDGSCLA